MHDVSEPPSRPLHQGASQDRSTLAPQRAGGAMVLGAALLFGASVPFVQRFSAGVGTFATAAAIGAGAAIGAVLPPASARDKRPLLGRAHAARLAAVVACGALLAPICLAWGLKRTSAMASSLLLNLELPVTALLGRWFYAEPLGPRSLAALGFALAGGLTLAAESEVAGATTALGVAAIAGAAIGWSLDNTLARPLAELDPRSVVLWKSLLGSVVSALLALASREPAPDPWAAAALLGCGIGGYGMSLRLYLRGQRVLGVARTASLFALAPFIGALLALALGERSGLGFIAIAAVLFAIAIYLQLTGPPAPPGDEA